MAAFGIARAHALAPGPAGGAAAHFVLSAHGGSGITAVHLTLAHPVQSVSIRLGGSGWIACRTAGLRASCPLAGHRVRTASVRTLEVVATS